MEGFFNDLRYSVRQFRRMPLLVCAILATLALAIGANTLLFAIANATLFRALPYPDPSRLISPSIVQKGRDVARIDEPTARFAAAGLPVFEAFGLYNSAAATLLGGEYPERLVGARVSESFFHVLGTKPVLGRTFTADELRPNGPLVIVLSDAVWTRRFGRQPGIVGERISMDDGMYEVIGVMPRGFGFPGASEFWRPLIPRQVGPGAVYYVDGIARLAPFRTPEEARAALVAMRESRKSEMPAAALKSEIRVISLQERLYGNFTRPLVLLLGAVACVLFIGCANVANLLLARGAARRQEIAIRAALGAGRGRLVRQMLVESVLLALLGSVPAFVLLTYALQAFTVLGPVELRAIPGIAVDGRVLAFMVTVTLAVGLLFGIAPALAARRAEPHEPLKGSGGRGGHGVRSRPRRILVSLEVAAAAVVIVGAALLTKSLIRFQAVDRGFHTDNVLTASITLPSPRYADVAARRAFFDAVLERLRSLPSVESAAIPAGLGHLSMTMSWPSGTKSGPPGSDSEEIGVVSVGTSYFKTFDIPMRGGRECDGGPEPSTVINERMARRAFPGRSPVGEKLDLSLNGTFTVVGVAADVRKLGTNAAPFPMVFTCVSPREAPNTMNIAVRARADIDAASLAPALRAAVAAVDPAQPVAAVRTLRQLVDDSEASRRFETLLFAAFALLAFALAVFGLYAVTAYLVAQQTHELGVRIALGADRAAVLRLVLRQGLTPAIAGIVLGLLAAGLLTGLLRKMLYEVDVLDASVFAGVAIALALVSLAAAVVPARRAVQVDPVEALRCE